MAFPTHLVSGPFVSEQLELYFGLSVLPQWPGPPRGQIDSPGPRARCLQDQGLN